MDAATLRAYRWHRGHNGDPIAERASQALWLARAEVKGSSADLVFHWREGEQYGWDGDGPAPDPEKYTQLECYVTRCCPHCGSEVGETLASLGGVYLSTIWGNDPYRRTVEAELAHEALS